MKAVIALIGIAMIGIGIGTWLVCLKTGVCVGLIIVGCGLVIDSVLK